MNIIHIMQEVPYPPTNGIRCDMWRRQQAFRSLGHDLFSIYWASEAANELPSDVVTRKIESLSLGSSLIVIRKSLKSRILRTLRLFRYPSYVASRIVSQREFLSLVKKTSQFKPDMIWLEGVHAQVLAIDLAKALNIPLFYRAHNIEFSYLAEQARLSNNVRRRVALLAGTLHLKRFEFNLHRAATHVFDISSDDVAYWNAMGFSNTSWLPPLASIEMRSTPRPDAAGGKEIDLLYVGGLAGPNNEAGLRWYFREVHPLIVALIPDIKITIAGRNPSDEFAITIKQAGATLVANPISVRPLLDTAKVIMNPILHGSGVNIKTIDMLSTDAELVSTSKGVRGLPPSIFAHIGVEDTASGFASAIVNAIGRFNEASVDTESRTALVANVFGESGLRAALEKHCGAQS